MCAIVCFSVKSVEWLRIKSVLFCSFALLLGELSFSSVGMNVSGSGLLVPLPQESFLFCKGMLSDGNQISCVVCLQEGSCAQSTVRYFDSVVVVSVSRLADYIHTQMCR